MAYRYIPGTLDVFYDIAGMRYLCRFKTHSESGELSNLMVEQLLKVIIIKFLTRKGYQVLNCTFNIDDKKDYVIVEVCENE